jgi:hypothetical protein
MMLVQSVYDIPKFGLRRADAFAVGCPQCGAEAGSPCTGKRNPAQVRTSPHLQRYDAAAQARRMMGGDV